MREKHQKTSLYCILIDFILIRRHGERSPRRAAVCRPPPRAPRGAASDLRVRAVISGARRDRFRARVGSTRWPPRVAGAPGARRRIRVLPLGAWIGALFVILDLNLIVLRDHLFRRGI